MKTTADYLDELRAHFGARSDYALHPHTGWRLQQISRYRKCRSSFDDETAEKVAAWLNIDLAPVLVDMNAQRARSEKIKRAWAAISAALPIFAAVVIGSEFLTSAPAPLDAAAQLDAATLYIMSNAATLILAALALALLTLNPKARPAL